MKSKKDQCVRTIGHIRRNIEDLDAGDPKAWNTIGSELAALDAVFPKNLSVPRKTLELCARTVDTLAENTRLRSFTLIETLTAALNAIEAYLQAKSPKKSAIGKAERQLEEALAKQRTGVETAAAEPVPPPPAAVTLDDAAALLIQLEPGDRSGLKELQTVLRAVAADANWGETCRNPVEAALQQIDAIVAGSAVDSQAALQQAGRLLETAMEAGDPTAGPEPVTSGRPSPDSEPPDAALSAAAAQSGSEGPPRAALPQETAAEPEHPLEVEPAAADYMPQDADPDLLAEFITESSELISRAEEALLTLETDPEDMDAVNTVFRAFHTVKGTAAFMDLMLISEMGHHAESLLSRVRESEIRYTGGYADLSLRALDMIKDLIVSVQDALQGRPLAKPAGYDELMQVLADPEGSGITEAGDGEAPRLGDLLVAQGKVERETVEQVAREHPDEKIGTSMVKDGAAAVTDVGRALRSQKRMQGSGQLVESSVRVSTQRLDRLVDMVGELVIAQSMVAQDHLVVNGNHHELVKKISQTGKIVRELQNISMSMRMVPLKATFNKMARLVRDLSRKVGKNVHFVTEGEDTEIDRNLVDIINDPLVHMVRNAVDHGIETAEMRKQLGKPEYGTVKLAAYHSAGNVVVEIEDDGKGLDRERILAKAREKQLVGDGASLSDREVFNLIFEPGFSTAQSITDVSGRGVGLDVVKKNIESFRGQAEIRSEPGKGSVFRVILPLTLAIIDGMVVRVGTENYVIPTVSIVRSIKPSPGDISTVYQRGEMLSLQGQLIPLFRLAELYQVNDADREPDQELTVVVEDEGRHVGLLIDELVGRQQVVIKSLGETMSEIPGISGGAILPNGRVGLILDIGGLTKFATAGNDDPGRDESESRRPEIHAA